MTNLDTLFAELAKRIARREHYVTEELAPLKLVVEAALAHVGMNITRPEVFDGRDSSKAELARALAALGRVGGNE